MKVKKLEDFVFFVMVELYCCMFSLIINFSIEIDIYVIDLILGYFKYMRKLKEVIFFNVDLVKEIIFSKILNYGYYFMKIIGILDKKWIVSSFGYVEVMFIILVVDILGVSYVF